MPGEQQPPNIDHTQSVATADFFAQMGISSEQAKSLTGLLQESPESPRRKDFDRRVISALGDMVMGKEVYGEALAVQARGLLQATGRALKTAYPDGSAAQALVRQAAQSTRNDLVAVTATVLTGLTPDDAGSQAVIRTLEDYCREAAQDQGISLSAENSPQIRMWASQHLPLIASLTEGGQTVLAVLIQCMEGENQPAANQFDRRTVQTWTRVRSEQPITAWFEEAKNDVIKELRSQGRERHIQEETEDHDWESAWQETCFNPGRYGYLWREGWGITLKTDNDKAIRIAVQQFHPELGLFWTLPPQEATNRLSLFTAVCAQNRIDLPADIKAMLCLAALAPDRGLAVKPAKYQSRRPQDITEPDWQDETLRGLVSLVAECPPSLQSLSEAVLVRMIETNIKSLADVSPHDIHRAALVRRDIVMLAMIGLAVSEEAEKGFRSCCSDQFLAYFMDLGDRLAEKTGGAVELMDWMAQKEADWPIGPDEEGKGHVVRMPSFVPLEEQGGFFDVTYYPGSNPEEFQKSKVIVTEQRGRFLVYLDHLDHKLDRSAAFMQYGRRYLARASSPEQRMVRLFNLVPQGLNLSPEFRQGFEDLVMETLAAVPNGTSFICSNDGRGDINTLFRPDPDGVLRHISYQVETRNKWDNPETVRVTVDSAAISQIWERVQRKRRMSTRISQELHIGGDKSHALEAQLAVLRRDPLYREWEAGAREEAFALLAEIGPLVPDKEATFYREEWATSSFSSKNHWLEKQAGRALGIRDATFGDRINFQLGEAIRRVNDHAADLSWEEALSAVELVSGGDFGQMLKGLLWDCGHFTGLSDDERTNGKGHIPLFVQQKVGKFYYYDNYSYEKSALAAVLAKISEQDVRTQIERLSQLSAAAVSLSEHPFFRKVVDMSRVQQEILQAQQAYEGWLNCPDRAKWKWNLAGERSELAMFYDLALTLMAAGEGRRVMSTVVAADQAYRADNAVSLRLADEAEVFSHATYGLGPPKVEYGKIIPISCRLAPGELWILSGPTGSGKTAWLEAFFYALLDSDFLAPLASRVEAPGSQLVVAEIGEVGLLGDHDPAMSDFQNSSRQAANKQGRPLVISDEPFAGSPSHYRIGLIAANLVRKMVGGGTQAVASHQAYDIARIMHILGFDEQVHSLFIDPLTHQDHPGIGGSFGLEMMETKGLPAEFIGLCRTFLKAGEAALPPGSLSLEGQKLPKEAKKGDFASEDVLREVEADEICRILAQRAGCGRSPETVKRMLKALHRALNSENNPLPQQITAMEQMAWPELKHILGVIPWLAVLAETDEKAPKEPIKKLLAKPDGEPGILRQIMFLERIGQAKGLGDIAGLRLLGGQMPPDAREPVSAVIDQMVEAIAGSDQNPDMAAFTKALQEDFMREYRVNGIEKTLKQWEILDDSWKEQIKQARIDQKKGDYQSTCALYLRYVLIHCERQEPIEGDAVQIVHDLAVAYAKKWSRWMGEGEEDGSAASFLGQVVSSVGPYLDPVIFSAVQAYSSRPDHQAGDLPFCQPERGDGQMPFPVQFSQAVNIPTAGRVKKYVPQDLLTADGPMALADLPQPERLQGNPIRVLHHTGVQGGGKTDIMKLQAQIRIWAEATGRVPAKWAKLGPRPSRILTKMAMPRTEGKSSTFMREAEMLETVVNSLARGAEVYLNEPGSGTVAQETTAIVAALGYLCARMGCTLTLTNQEADVDKAWDRLASDSSFPWYTTSFTYTDDPAKKFRLSYGVRGGAESFRIAEEMGLDPGTVKLAEMIGRINQEYQDHILRILG